MTEEIDIVQHVAEAITAQGVGWRGERLKSLAQAVVDTVREVSDPDEVSALRRQVARLKEALDPFARAWRVVDAVPAQFKQPLDDEDGARDILPGAWPTVGDLRKADEAMR